MLIGPCRGSLVLCDTSHCPYNCSGYLIPRLRGQSSPDSYRTVQYPSAQVVAHQEQKHWSYSEVTVCIITMAKGKSASSSKRKPEAIDLTGSDDDDGKRQRQNRSSWRRPDANESLSQRSPSSRNPPNTSRNQSLGAIQAERDAWLAPNASQQSNLDDSDIYESISSTQNYSSNSDSWMRYGHLAGKIVGVRYYDGFATYGEKVLLLREPGNPYDSNGWYFVIANVGFLPY